METVARVLAHLATQQAQVHGEKGPARSAVMEFGRQLSLAGGDITLTGKLIEKQGQAIIRIYNLETEETQLIVTRSAITNKGSVESIPLPRPGRREKLNPLEHLGDRKRNHSLVIHNPMLGK